MPGKDEALNIMIYGSSQAGLDALEVAFGASELGPKVRFCLDEEQDAQGFRIACGVETIELSKPVRVGHIIDTVAALTKSALSETAEEIVFGKWSLNVAYSTLTKPDGHELKLTEKETAILRFLNIHQEMSKEDLLKAVWEYAEDVETHTLETHIYRLRQKVEDDPAAPELVITTENGYAIKG